MSDKKIIVCGVQWENNNGVSLCPVAVQKKGGAFVSSLHRNLIFCIGFAVCEQSFLQSDLVKLFDSRYSFCQLTAQQA